MNSLKISRSFNVDDIRRVRDHNYEITKNMSRSEVREYYKQSANAVAAEVERIRKTLGNKAYSRQRLDRIGSGSGF